MLFFKFRKPNEGEKKSRGCSKEPHVGSWCMLVLVTFVVSLFVSEKRASLALVKIDQKRTRLVTIFFYCPPVMHL